MTRRAAPWIGIAVLAAIAIASRLPQLLSPNLLAEGDESLVGLMGMHVARGHDFPLFFYGQKYGLAVVEVTAAAVSFAIFGAGPVALKGAILAIWIVGAALYFRAFARVLGTTRSFWITLLLVLMPAWGVTSMKAWSGYVTAFATSGLVMDLVTRSPADRVATWLAAGAATAVIYFAQPLWLPALLPIVLYLLVKSRRTRCWAAYVGGAILPIVVMALVDRYWMADANEVWFTPALGNPQWLTPWPLLKQIYVDLTGSFYFGIAILPGRVTAALGALWFALLWLLLALQGYRLVTRRHSPWPYLLAASIVLTLASTWMLIEARDARYVMAINVPLVFLAGIELFDLADRLRVPLRRTVAAIVLVAIAQAAAMSEFAGYTFMWWTNRPGSPSETKTLNTVIGYLQSRGVTRVYAMNGLLEWTLMFYSRESVIARWKFARDRYPPYIQTVDRALQAGRPVAIVGYSGYTYGLERLVPDPEAIVDIDGKYYVYLGANRDLLTRIGIRLTR